MYLVNYTKLGRAMRATAEKPARGGLMACARHVISATFIIGAALAALAGVMWAANYGSPRTPWASCRAEGVQPRRCSAASATGRAMVGGVALGVIEALAQATSVRSPGRARSTTRNLRVHRLILCHAAALGPAGRACGDRA